MAMLTVSVPLVLAQANAPLQLIYTVPLPDVRGRIGRYSLGHTKQALNARKLGLRGNAMTLAAFPAFTSSEMFRPLPFDAKRLDGLSERLILSHWENNYGGTVKALAIVKKQLADALANKDTPPFVYNDLKREHLLRTGSVVLHELYFENLGGGGRSQADARDALSRAFGSYDMGNGVSPNGASGSAVDPAGSCSVITSTRARWRTTGFGTTCMAPLQRCRCS
jgi:hypothetical protein